MSENLADLPLKDLARMYLELMKKVRKNIRILEDVERFSTTGKHRYKFDFIIEDPVSGDIIGVQVKDWRRTLGVNAVFQFWRKVQEAGLTMGILIGTEFSDQARNRPMENIFLISKGELISYLRSVNMGEIKEISL